MNTRTDLGPMPDYFETYIQKVPERNLFTAFENGTQELQNLNLPELETRCLYAYAPGKWTILEVFQHLVDTERIMIYRALAFARGEQGSLPGYEDDDYVRNSNANKRSISSFMEEWLIVRQSSLLFFQHLETENLKRVGRANGKDVSVLSIAFMIIGHQRHHLQVIKDKYLI